DRGWGPMPSRSRSVRSQSGCVLVHPWPTALYFLGVVATSLGRRLPWTWRSRRPVPSWLILGFVLANAVLLIVTLLVLDPFVPSPRPMQMALP
ncbi:hypothetical protein, partial [Geminicoccus flavidas]|uniref:hypothetical protein n=1 Tax=Geminicoccus flavidas TaxID=2506407 RepID=UPI001F34C43C